MAGPRPRSLRPEHQVVVAAAGFVVFGAACVAQIYQFGGLTSSLRDGSWWALPAVAILFGIFDHIVFSWHVRHEGMSFSLSEIPTALALVFLPPWMALAARLPLSLAVLVRTRRNPYYKVLFNSANYLLELALAILMMRLLTRWWGTSDARIVTAAAASIALIAPEGIAAVSIAISRFEGGLWSRLWGELRSSWWMFVINTGTAAMVLSLVMIQPELGLVALPTIAGMWFVLWSFGGQRQRLRELDAVQGFSVRIGETLDVGEIGDAAVAEIAPMLRAEGVALVRFENGRAVETHLTGNVPIAIPARVNQIGWPNLLAEPDARLVTAGEFRRVGIIASTGAIVATIRDDDTAVATLIVAGRSEQANRLDTGDVERVQNLVGQLATSLRRGLLHERLEYEARHDALTGLPTRTLFERSVQEVFDGSRGGGITAVMMLDLDRFKEVNDTLGHHAGDDVLVTFGRRITPLLNERDVLSRLAGDEFALLVSRRSMIEINDLAVACVAAAGEPIVVDSLEIVVTASCGVAVINRDDSDAVQPMRRADIAMYNAKWQRSGVEFYRDEIDRRTPARLSMLGDLRTAIHSDQLDVVYQPKFDLNQGKVIGVEALVRWESPSRGVVPPQEFVRVAEDTGLIKALTDFVLGRGIRDIAALRAQGISTGLAVNVSTHDLFDSRLPQRVVGYLERYHLPASALTLEITESSLFVDAPRTRATIDALHNEGIRLAIDDFGTGYSSLAYLRQMPVIELKIDQSFVTGLATNPHDEVIVRSTVDLGHNLGLRVVAEGVESLASLDRLRDMGCDIVQGFAISPPIRATGLGRWLSDVDEAIRTGGPLPWAVTR